MSDRIAVIIPNYNHGKYIETNINGLMKQSNKNWEALIIDDASTDDSVDIINKIVEKEERIKLIKLDNNMGVVRCINVGLQNATTDYVYFSAADDYICNENFFEIAIRNLKKYQCGVFFGKSQVIDGISNKYLNLMGHAKRTGYQRNDKILFDFFDNQLFIPGSSAIFNRRMLLEIGQFKESLGAQTDFFHNHAIAVKFGYFYSNDIYVKVRYFIQSLSNSINLDEKIRNHFFVARSLIEIDNRDLNSKKIVIYKYNLWIRKFIRDNILFKEDVKTFKIIKYIKLFFKFKKKPNHKIINDIFEIIRNSDEIEKNKINLINLYFKRYKI